MTLWLVCTFSTPCTSCSPSSLLPETTLVHASTKAETPAPRQPSDRFLQHIRRPTTYANTCYFSAGRVLMLGQNHLSRRDGKDEKGERRRAPPDPPPTLRRRDSPRQLGVRRSGKGGCTEDHAAHLSDPQRTLSSLARARRTKSGWVRLGSSLDESAERSQTERPNGRHGAASPLV